jgi:hypothetical protein
MRGESRPDIRLFGYVIDTLEAAQWLHFPRGRSHGGKSQ